MAVAAQRHEARLVAAQQRLEALATAVESRVEINDSTAVTRR